MPNQFSKEERVAFEQLLEGFEDALVFSRHVAVYRTDQTMMERTNNVIWRPQPYILPSYNGTDQTANFNDKTQLTVPASIGYQKSVPWMMTATELRDALQEGRLGDAAKQRLASDINVSLLQVASQQGTIVVSSSSSAKTLGFDAVANIDTAMNRVGIRGDSRYLALSSVDYQGLASDLAFRQNMTDLPKEAYRRAFVGMVAQLETYKMDYALTQTAAAGSGITIDTRASAGNYYTPLATQGASGNPIINVDNRYQTITVSSSANVAAGDAFTIAGVTEANHITKLDTTSLKTFRVISVPAGGTTLVISPPIISNQGGTQSEVQYQNCVVSTSATAAIVFLNTQTKFVNPFWHRDAIELLPGRYVVPENAGVAVMRATTEQGIEITMTKFYDINTMKTKYRLDVFYGVTMVQPEMAGIALFSQT